jgi:hypothetical protein
LGGGQNPVRLVAEHGSIRITGSLAAAADADDETEEDDTEGRAKEPARD